MMKGTLTPISNQARWLSTKWRLLKPVPGAVHRLLHRVGTREALHQVCQTRGPAALASSIRREELTSQNFPDDSGNPVSEGDRAQFCVVNFYHLVDIENPQQMVEEHKVWMTGKDIRGRIYLSTQGINAQYSGAWDDAVAYPKWLEQQREFQGLRWNCEPAQEHLFPKLRLQFKPNLVQLSGGMSSLPITSPEARATPLSPSQWKDMLKDAIDVSEKTSKSPVVLDIRNGYEWDAGHFEGAHRPAEDSFCQTPVGKSKNDVPEFLGGKDPDTPVMMYCTGGIRCDVYSTFLRKKGFENLYTLEGGVQEYFKEEGGDHWKGSLFVFDGRLAIPPEQNQTTKALPAAIPCELCGANSAELPHMNCANVDCNKLFVACRACKVKVKGCCCEQCIDAPRLLRPMLESGMYGKWGNYSQGSRRSRTRHLAEVEGGSLGEPAAKGKTRRKRLSARKQAKREALREKKQRHKALAKAAIEARENSGEPPVSISLQEGLSGLQIKS